MKQIITYENKVYDITDEQVEKIMLASTEGKQNGIWLGSNYIAFPSIKEICEKSYDYHQPYETNQKMLSGNVFSRSTKNAKELMLKGFKKRKPTAKLEDLEKFFKPEKKEVKYNHIKNNKGEIIKYAWEVAREAEMLPV